MRTAIGVTVTLAIAVLVANLALAPVHGVHTADDCARAYANATSRTDSISVDMLSYPDRLNRSVTRRCGERQSP